MSDFVADPAGDRALFATYYAAASLGAIRQDVEAIAFPDDEKKGGIVEKSQGWKGATE